MPRKRSDQAGNKATKAEESSDLSTHPRKRKANVAICLQDPDEEIAEIQATKKREHEIEPFWNSNPDLSSPSRLLPTPDKEVDEVVPIDSCSHAHSESRSMWLFNRSSPLPVLSWASQNDVWKNMIRKEEMYVKDKRFMQRHPLLQPKMRAILLDWLMEVCEVYKLHRETFYLAQDFFDRFMGTQQNVVKTRLQLIGISALFIAAKLEEIYPPKLHQFAHVTDGACTEEEINDMELVIMKALKWSLSPLTLVAWLNVYLQIAYLNLNCNEQEVLLPQYPQETFVQVIELIDLCVLDIGCLEFAYSVLAASALCHFSSYELMQRVSGYNWSDIGECMKWMSPFLLAIKEVGSSKLKFFKAIAQEDMHNIQTHSNYLDLLDKAEMKRPLLAEENCNSPVPSGVLTPPHSSKKQNLGLYAS
uniref:Cyclin E1 n=1 Tax=Latimeria chalumnae TaxID=7897 RepID=H2ZYD1_LATCH